MFFSEKQAIDSCIDDPLLVFKLIEEDAYEVLDFLIRNNKVSINQLNTNGDNLVMALLKKENYNLALKYLRKKNFDINHQNNEGNTIAHLLARINYVDVMEIIKYLLTNKDFKPNIENNLGDTMLDVAIKNDYVYTVVKILENDKFNNLTEASFSRLYQKYIRTNEYGKIFKLNTLEIIVDLEERIVNPIIKSLIRTLKANYDSIKTEIFNNEFQKFDYIMRYYIYGS